MSITSHLTSLWRDTRGNTAVFFALAAIPVVMVAGGTIDYVSAERTKARLQTAVDAAALAAAASNNLTKKERRKAARKALALNFVNSQNLKPRAKFRITKKEVEVRATVKQPATFLKLIGISNLPISATALVKREYGTLDLALVLDNTYSMTGSKITTLKKAAKKLVKNIFKKDDERNIRISIVPFTQYVRLDLKYKNAPWMRPPHEYSVSYPGKCKKVPEYKKYNCHTVNNTGYKDGISYSWKSTLCDKKLTGRKIKKCSKDYTVYYKWKGCVGSRNYPLNSTDDSYSTDKIIPLVDNNSCPQKIMPLKNKDSQEDLVTMINQMVPRDNETYIPAGLLWGWRTLSKIAPFDEGKAYAPENRKALVLMTDGANTVIASGGRHNRGPSFPKAPEADNLTAEICENIKAKGIRLYTVAFEVSDQATKNMLEACASSSSDYYDASDDDKLLAAFESIANSLRTVYLAK